MSQLNLFETGNNLPLPDQSQLPEIRIEPSWKLAMKDEFEQEYFKALKNFLLTEKQDKRIIYPPGQKIFAAFDYTPFDKVKVIIIGQDPYHGAGQANGLCFSVSDGVPHPPSLQNIFKELQADLNITVPRSGSLEPWARQGVLLLNAILTVRANEPASHRNRGWEQFTDEVIRTLSAKKNGLVFILWGNFARSKKIMIDTTKHFVLEAAHPSPFSAHSGFFGCKHFSRTNEILIREGLSPIDWKLI